MIDINGAITSVRKKYPNRNVMQVIDYDPKWFLVVAVEDIDKVDFDSPYFAVNKRDGSVKTYSPVDDIEKFTDAIQHRSISID